MSYELPNNLEAERQCQGLEPPDSNSVLLVSPTTPHKLWVALAAELWAGPRQVWAPGVGDSP